jgi:hypothetical protein
VLLLFLLCVSFLLLRYEAQLEKDWRFIVEDSGAKLVVASNMRIYDIVKSYVKTVGNVQHTLCLQSLGEGISYEPLMDRYRCELETEGGTKHISSLLSLSPDHVALLIYTSGASLCHCCAVLLSSIVYVYVLTVPNSLCRHYGQTKGSEIDAQELLNSPKWFEGTIRRSNGQSTRAHVSAVVTCLRFLQ